MSQSQNHDKLVSDLNVHALVTNKQKLLQLWLTLYLAMLAYYKNYSTNCTVNQLPDFLCGGQELKELRIKGLKYNYKLCFLFCYFVFIFEYIAMK